MEDSKICPKCGAEMHEQGGDYGVVRLEGKYIGAETPTLPVTVHHCQKCHYLELWALSA